MNSQLILTNFLQIPWKRRALKLLVTGLRKFSDVLKSFSVACLCLVTEKFWLINLEYGNFLSIVRIGTISISRISIAIGMGISIGVGRVSISSISTISIG